MAKMILVGAACVQVVSTLYKNGVEQIGKMLESLNAWMERKGYGSLDAFRGKMSKQRSQDPWIYTRAQYVKLLMNPKDLLENNPAP